LGQDIRLGEQIPLIQFCLFDNSRFIIQEWGIWQVIELGEILCTPTYSLSLIKTGRKLFDLESGNPNFGQLKGHNSGVPMGDLAGYRTWSRHYAHQHIHQV